MTHAILTEADDSIEFIVNTRVNVSINHVDPDVRFRAVLERWRPGFQDWLPMDDSDVSSAVQYGSAIETMLEAGALGTRYRIRLTPTQFLMGGIQVEVW